MLEDDMSKAEVIHVGIDVSAKKLNLAFDTSKKWFDAEFDNSQKGYKSLINYLRKRAKSSLVCLEATGIYHLDLSRAIHDADGINVMVINPKAAKSFASAMMQRGKTDRADARMLASYALRMEFKIWQPPRKEIWELRDISRRSNVLSRMRSAEKNRLHASRNETIDNDIEVNIRHINRRLELLEKQAMALIEHDDELLTIFTLLITIKGIAKLSAIRIMGEVMMLPKDMKARQWVAHAGLDPRCFESGSSVNKKVRISKVGNIHLRQAMYMPALSASVYDENVMAFREALEERGKKPMQAIIAVMRKLLHTIHGMLKNNQPYRSEMFYQPEKKSA